MAPTAWVDLHVHSTASDGELAPAEVARRAHGVRLAAIALTDHDTTAGVADAAAEGARLGVRVIAGCEFSVKAPWGELHLLGYFLPTVDDRLDTFLTETRAARRRRGELMVERLQGIGIDIDVGQVAAVAGEGAVGRPHVARALVARGVTATVGEAFHRFLRRGRPGFVEKPLPALEQVTGLIHSVGGLAVAAHLRGHGDETTIRRLCEQGLDGLEVRHPSHERFDEQRLTEIAGRLGLAVTGGSDWHGDEDPGTSHAGLGDLDVPAAWLEDLERRRTG
jgi:hypothetical protein